MWAEKTVFSLFPFNIRKSYRLGGGEDKEEKEGERERRLEERREHWQRQGESGMLTH